MSDKHSKDHSATSTGIRFVRLAPALVWVPRWFRYNLTLQHVLGFIAVVFCSGVGWAQWHLESKMNDNQRALQSALAPITAALSTECVRGCLVKTEDLRTLERQVGELSKLKQGVDTEYNTNLQPIAKPAPAAFEPPKKPARLK